MSLLSTQELILSVRADKNLSPLFVGVFPLNHLPVLHPSHPLPLGFIVNTDTANLPGTHWLAVIVLPNQRGEFFDSFGQPPPPLIQLWLNKHCLRGWIASKEFIQGPLSTLCGAYCILYLHLRLVHGFSMHNIIHNVLLSSSNPDLVVQRFFFPI